MSLRVVLLTRSGRPSGALMAWRLCQAGIAPVIVLVEKRSRMIRGKGNRLDLLSRLGLSFLAKKVIEAARIRTHYVLRKCLRSRYRNSVYLSIEELAIDHPVKLYEVSDHNGADTERLMRDFRPDIGILTNTRRIEKRILDIPLHGFLNLHLSALPKYAGLESIFWALLSGETEIGVTVHRAAETIDQGDIVLQRKIPVSPFDGEDSLYEKALWLGTKLMVQALKALEDGNFEPKPQAIGEGSYYSWPTACDRALLRARRKRKKLGAEVHSQGAIRVMHVITRMIHGGAQVNTLSSVRGLQARGFQVTLVTGLSWGSEGELVSDALEAGVDVVILPNLVREIHWVKDFICLLKLERLITRGRFLIVHTHTSKAGLLGRLAAKWTKVPVLVHTPHGHVFHSYFSAWKERIFLRIERWSARQCDRLVALTEQERREHLELGVGSPDQWVVIPSGVDETRFTEIPESQLMAARDRLGIEVGRKMVGFIGRLAPIKGARFLLEAAPRILDILPAAHFLLVGDGEEKKGLEEEAGRKGIRHRVTFAGHQDEVAPFLSLCDVLVVPSLNEGMGRVIVEAGLMAKPVVATRIGGITDLVENGKTGLLVSPRNSFEIAEAVVRIVKDPQLGRRLGEALRRRVLEGFTESQMVEKLFNLYRDMLTKKGIAMPRNQGGSYERPISDRMEVLSGR